jgi:hypothetical protein
MSSSSIIYHCLPFSFPPIWLMLLYHNSWHPKLVKSYWKLKVWLGLNLESGLTLKRCKVTTHKIQYSMYNLAVLAYEVTAYNPRKRTKKTSFYNLLIRKLIIHYILHKMLNETRFVYYLICFLRSVIWINFICMNLLMSFSLCTYNLISPLWVDTPSGLRLVFTCFLESHF